MTKRASFDVQINLMKIIRQNEGITMSGLEKKDPTNPNGLRVHCKQLALYGLIEIGKNNTLKITRRGIEVLDKVFKK